MKVKVIEKGDSSLTVRFEAESGQEAVILGMATVCETDCSLGTSSQTYGKIRGTVNVGGFSVPVIETLQPREGDK